MINIRLAIILTYVLQGLAVVLFGFCLYILTILHPAAAGVYLFMMLIQVFFFFMNAWVRHDLRKWL